MGKASQVMGQAKMRALGSLAIAGAAEHLQIQFIDHAEPGGADRMTEALEPAIDLTRHRAVSIVKSIEYIPDGAALRRDVQVFHGDELGHRKAVVDLEQADLVPR